jgi:hypothetical protein
MMCPVCESSLEVPYAFYDAEARCPVCGEHTVPKITTGTSIPAHGYGLSFGDFRQLVTYHEEVAPLLRCWYGVEILPGENGVRIKSASGADVQPLFLHGLIQADPGK